MSRAADETRRGFLKRLARTAAFAPPALVTLHAARVEAQKGPGQGKGQSAGQASSQAAASAQQTASQQATAIGGTTPTAQTQGSFRASPSLQSSQQEPWDPGRAAGTPPWAKPPPTSAGGGD